MTLPTVPDQLPKNDGDVNLYNSGHPPTTRRFIFVNGIHNLPRDHRDVGRKLSALTGADVYGVYNLSEDILTDFSQCVGDWASIGMARLGERLDQEVRDWVSPLGAIPMPIAQVTRGGIVSMADAVDRVFYRHDFQYNQCTKKLCELLVAEVDRWPSASVVIVPHSQGNLITSAALYAYFACLRVAGRTPRRRIKVFGLASPAPLWPENRFLGLRFYTNCDDMVTWLSLGQSFGSNNARVERAGNFTTDDPIAPHLATNYVHKTSFLHDLMLAL
jgi:hypothetical protein